VAQAYRAHERPSPCHEDGGKLHFLLERLLRRYKNFDPTPKGQKALTLSILREMSKVNFTPEDVATHESIRGAFFFAMRSCEYLKVEGTKQRTKLLKVRNLVSLKGTACCPIIASLFTWRTTSL
jgi:hypothetical protein